MTIQSSVKVVRADKGKTMGRSEGFIYGGTAGQEVIGKFDLNNEDEKISFITKFEGSFMNK